ncbi:MAG: OadG family protein [Acutalibacteraceae bacterium]
MIFTSDYSIKMPLGQTVLTAFLGIATVLLILAVIAVLITVVSKLVRLIEQKFSNEKPEKKAEVSENEIPDSSKVQKLPVNQSQGELTLIGTDEKTAAVIMALVSYQSGIPLNSLCFKSIKLLPEDKNK